MVYMTNTTTVAQLTAGQTVDLTALGRPGDAARCAAQAVKGSPAAAALTGTARVEALRSACGRGGRRLVVVTLGNGETLSLAAGVKVPLAG